MHGTDVRAAVLALVPFNRHLRLVDDTVVNPVALGRAYQAARGWGAAKDDVHKAYIAQVALAMAAVPPRWADAASGGAVVMRSHHPDDVHALLASRAAEVWLLDAVHLRAVCVAGSLTLHWFCVFADQPATEPGVAGYL